MPDDLIIEPYSNSHRAELLAIFRMHVPEYFAAPEEDDLVLYLDNHSDHFFVCKDGTGVIGCGGYNIEGMVGKLSWYFVHPAYQGKGVGKLLANNSLTQLMQNKELKKITVRTSQKADKFYERLGFRLLFVEKDFWGAGLDLYEMELIADAKEQTL